MDHDTDADRPSPALVDEAWKFAMMPFAHTAAVVGWQCGLLSSPWPRPVMTPAALAAEVLTCTPPADPELVLRLLRLLLLYGVFEQVGTDPARFRHTPLSDVLGRPNGSLAIAARACAGAARGATALPDYLAAVGYRSPGDAPSLFQWSRRTDQDLFDFMSKAPDASQKSAPRVSDDKSAPPERAVASGSGIAAVHGFNVAMEAMYRLTAFGPDGRTTALDPWAAEFAAAAAAAGGPFTIVDVGGGTGHVIKALRARLPADVAARGRFVLEDKAESMATLAATPPAGIELQAYNFMTEAQPVQGGSALPHSIALLTRGGSWMPADIDQAQMPTSSETSSTTGRPRSAARFCGARCPCWSAACRASWSSRRRCRPATRPSGRRSWTST